MVPKRHNKNCRISNLNPQMNDIERILDYWFGSLIDGWTVDNRLALWFGGNAKDDADIQEKFGERIADAMAGKLESWRQQPKSLMAYIILLDQMTRTVFRGTKKAFVGDGKALAACNTGIEQKLDLQLPPVYCCFFYLPLEHSESLAHQKQCIVMFQNAIKRFPKYEKEFVDSMCYTKKHLEIIQRFGRFPHRNIILGRKSTKEEKEYLAGDAPNFGQKPPK